MRLFKKKAEPKKVEAIKVEKVASISAKRIITIPQPIWEQIVLDYLMKEGQISKGQKPNYIKLPYIPVGGVLYAKLDLIVEVED